MITIDLKEASEALEKIKKLLKVNELSFDGSYNYIEVALEEFCFTNAGIYDEYPDLLDEIENDIIVAACQLLCPKFAADPVYLSIAGDINLQDCTLNFTVFNLEYEVLTTASANFALRSNSELTDYRINLSAQGKLKKITEEKPVKPIATATVKLTL
jgi:hypothetical protein